MPTQKQTALSEEEKRKMNTAFILMFPTFIIAMIAGFYANTVLLSVIVIALVIYQFTIIRKFIEDFYRR